MKHLRSVALPALAALALLAGAPAHADEGMWTFNDFPSQAVAEKYGFAPDAAWLDHVRLSTLRLENGCSASFVSANGLVMTNHHCANDCLANLSDRQHDYVARGYSARTAKDERRCPDLAASRLDAIEDVTARIHAATKGLEGEAFGAALRAETAQIEGACAKDAKTWCQVVTLYNGGRYDLYTYRRFEDVRLVFAPEIAIASFGGDPDNFEYPRYDLDVTFLRVYEDGKPYHPKDHLAWSPAGSKPGELVFTSGNPGSTSRLLTTSELAYERDWRLPRDLVYLAEWRGRLHEFGHRSDEAKRIAASLLDGVENGLKARRGMRDALADRAAFEKKQAAERALREKVQADPKLAAAYGDAWDRIDEAVAKEKRLEVRYDYIEGSPWRGPTGIRSELFRYARHLVRAAAERQKPDGERLPEYTKARLPGLEQNLFAKVPVYRSLEILNLTFSLEKLREALGPDDPFVKEVLAKESPAALAFRLVKDSRLENAALRKRLFEGGEKAIAASDDAMIVFARKVDGAARAVRKQWEDEVESVLQKQGTRIAQARFAVEGRGTYPDATFTLRLSYGTVKGWEQDGRAISPYTTIGGAFERATGYAPFALPRAWLGAKKRLDLATPMNLVSDNDIVGGNSGSPLVNAKGEVVGLIFDGNFQSLGGDYWFDDSVNRAVSVDSRALLESLEKVYGQKRLLEELRPAPAAPAGR